MNIKKGKLRRKQKISFFLLAILLLSQILGPGLALAQGGVSPEAYKLGFRLGLDLKDLEKIPSLDLESLKETGFSLDFILEEEGKKTQTQTMTYSPSGTWTGQVSFEGIQAPYKDLDIQYGPQDLGQEGEGRLAYGLRLKKGQDKMVLEVPQGVQVTPLAPLALSEGAPEKAQTQEKAPVEDRLNQIDKTDLVQALRSGGAQEDQVLDLDPGQEKSGQYLLSFDLIRPEFSEYEIINSVYFNHYIKGGVSNEVVDVDAWSLKDFKVDYKLHLDLKGDKRTLSQAMTYTAETYSWNGKIAFDPSQEIKVSSDQVKVDYYYQQIDGKTYYFEPYRLSYDLYLTEENGEVVLKVPKLYGSTSAYKPPKGNEKILGVKNISLSKIDSKIFLDGQAGDDANDGRSPEKPVKTFQRAKDLAKENQNIENIVVTGTVPIEGEISLEGTGAQLVRGQDFNGYLLRVQKGQEASLRNITIDGNAPQATKTREARSLEEGLQANPNIEKSLIEVDGGTLKIQEGTLLRNNKIKHIGTFTSTRQQPPKGGAIYAAKGSSLQMTGGTIEGNQATYGGGIYLNKSTLTFSGGLIQDNTVKLVRDKSVSPTQYYAAGGGILADKGSKIAMSGGAQVINNHSDENGGGISLGSQEWGASNILDMTGGLIDGNTAGSSGGGLFVQAKYFSGGASKATISSGKITNNQMTGKGVTNMAFGGGGIYVNGAIPQYGGNGLLEVTNVLITDNKAAYDGAGYAACPISNTTVEVNDGGAIYGNTASHKAHDLYVLCSWSYGIHSGSPDYKLSPRMLGGVPYNWLEEGDQPLEKLQGTLDRSGQELALHTDSQGNDQTRALAKVIISGNYSATRGGGIGSNGDVTIGEEGPTTQVPVEKVWADEDNASGKRPDAVTVKLMATVGQETYQVDQVILSAENNWKYTFTDLPTKAGGQEISYQVEEEVPEGYTGAITGNAQEGFIITNTPEGPTTQVPVEKRWADEDNASGKRPDAITVKLMAKIDGVEKEVDRVVLSAENDWKHTFTDLALKEDGKDISYRVEEEVPEGYTGTITETPEGGFIITNTPEGPTTQVPVE
ncbi:MAG: Cna B-type domain-containing protein, partial [Tissierellia bacterium]|nr:Cna B-type domain-containing protein [Tissierellia bacterium]